jgi:hypothetical protein
LKIERAVCVSLTPKYVLQNLQMAWYPQRQVLQLAQALPVGEILLVHRHLGQGDPDRCVWWQVQERRSAVRV